MREKPVVGVGAVIIKDGKILLVKRGNEPNKGKWAIPGGLVNTGESLEDALKREIMEEVGFEIEVDDVVCVSEEIFRDGNGVKYHYIVIDFFVDVIGGELRAGSDAVDARWVKLNEIDSLDVVDFVKKLVNKILRNEDCIYLK